jgi:hypothetical protein
MPELRRPTPSTLVPELTRRLAEDYHSLPLPEVSRVVREAFASVAGPDGRWEGTPEGIPAAMAVIEQVAREDLDQRSAPTPAPDGRGPRAGRRSERRRGAA